MPVRTKAKSRREGGGAYVERLPKGRGSAKMPNPGVGYIVDPESRRKVPVPKHAPKRRRHQKT